MCEVAVLIPLYNVEHYIKRCLDSVIAQQGISSMEIIVVNDGSTDGSSKIVSEYIKKNPHYQIRLIEHERNLGLMMARRTAYMAANSDYICFLDSDDFLPENALQLLIDGIKASKSDIYIGAMQSFTDKGTPTIHHNFKFGTFNSSQILDMLLRQELSHSLCGRIFSRELFKDPSSLPALKNQVNSEDLMLFYTLACNAQRITVSDGVVYSYYLNPKSSSKIKFSNNQFKQIILATNYLFTLLQARPQHEALLAKYLKHRVLSVMMQGCSQSIIRELTIPTVKHILSPANSMRQLGVVKGGLYFLLWHFPPLRKLTEFHYN